jgi:hypothetical protein
MDPEVVELLREFNGGTLEDMQSPLANIANDIAVTDTPVYNSPLRSGGDISKMLLQRSQELRPDRASVERKRDAIMEAYKNLIAAQQYKASEMSDPGLALSGAAMLQRDPTKENFLSAFGRGQEAQLKYNLGEEARRTAAEQLQAKTGLESSATDYGFDSEDQKNELDMLKTAGQIDYRDAMADLRAMQINAMNARATQKKPMPATALKMQQEGLDMLGIASSIEADISATRAAIESGDLDLGLIKNLSSRAKNFASRSDAESRNYSTFYTTMKKLQNDSLRLNKGTQTEGDAERAWNELFDNINDEKNVAQQLQKIEDINKRAALMHEMNIENIRANYGLESLELENYKNQPSAVFNKKGTKLPQEDAGSAPAGIEPNVWQHMTPEEKALFQSS